MQAPETSQQGNALPHRTEDIVSSQAAQMVTLYRETKSVLDELYSSRDAHLERVNDLVLTLWETKTARWKTKTTKPSEEEVIDFFLKSLEDPVLKRLAHEGSVSNDRTSFVDTLKKCAKGHQTLATELEYKILRKLHEFVQGVLHHPDSRDFELCQDFPVLLMHEPEDGFGLQWQLGLDNPMVRKLRTAIENGAKAEVD